jgi:hypothetical protein
MSEFKVEEDVIYKMAAESAPAILKSFMELGFESYEYVPSVHRVNMMSDYCFRIGNRYMCQTSLSLVGKITLNDGDYGENHSWKNGRLLKF